MLSIFRTLPGDQLAMLRLCIAGSYIHNCLEFRENFVIDHCRVAPSVMRHSRDRGKKRNIYLRFDGDQRR